MMVIIVKPVYGESRCSLTLRLQDNNHRTVNGQCTVYKLQPYLKDQTNSVKKAENIIKQYHLQGQTKTSRYGSVIFSGLKAGTYLVVQSSSPKGYYPFKSFLVKLPEFEKEANSYRYNVTCFPKLEAKKTITETPQLPVYEIKESNGKKKTAKKEKPVPVKKTVRSSSVVKTGDETILSVLVGIMLIAAVTMIVAKKMK